LDYHEAPFFDIEDTTVLEEGMVMTIEPGLYVEGFGVRHSDTILITEDGYENITYYPQELEELMIQA
jgi:Xaa-Pro dipeptidase